MMLMSYELYLLLLFGCYFFFAWRFPRRPWAILIGLFGNIVIFFLSSDYLFLLLTLPLSLGCVFLSSDVPIPERIRDVWLSFLMAESISGAWSVVLSFMTVSSEVRYPAEHLLTMLTVLAMIVGKDFYLKTRKKDTAEKTGRKGFWMFCLLAIMATGMLTAVSILNSYAKSEEYLFFKRLTLAIILITNLSIIGTVVLYVTVIRLNRQLSDLLYQERNMGVMQQQYYDALLEKEEETRRFRHDLHNHLIGLRQYAADGDTDRLLQYLSTMEESVSGIQKRVILSGNTMIDALTNYYAGLLPDRSMLSFQGKLPEELPVDAYQVNTIYSNLLQNAVEAVLGGRDPSAEQLIEVRVRLGQAFLQMTIRNPSFTGKRYLFRSGQDAAHGFGLKNVRRSLEGLGGTLNENSEDGFFTAEVVIPVLQQRVP